MGRTSNSLSSGCCRAELGPRKPLALTPAPAPLDYGPHVASPLPILTPRRRGPPLGPPHVRLGQVRPVLSNSGLVGSGRRRKRSRSSWSEGSRSVLWPSLFLEARGTKAKKRPFSMEAVVFWQGQRTILSLNKCFFFALAPLASKNPLGQKTITGSV